jgi:hypothetical protein
MYNIFFCISPITSSSSYPYPTKWGRYNMFFHHVVIKIWQFFFTTGRLRDVNPP